ncbi:hypothetical protein D3C78_1353260 [compost metagenome]
MRLYIPMYDLIVMGMIQSVRDLRSNPNGFFHLQWRTLFNNFIQVLAFHILHYNVMDLILLSNIIYTYDIRMG